MTWLLLIWLRISWLINKSDILPVLPKIIGGMLFVNLILSLFEMISNNKNIYNDIKGYIVNPWDTVCKLIYASPIHLSSDSDNKFCFIYYGNCSNFSW